MFIKIKLRPVPHPAFSYLLTFSFVLLLASSNDSFAQSGSSDNEPIFTVAEKQPEFPGGMQAFQDYLTTNVRYPAAAYATKRKSNVFVSFIVRSDGRITDVNVSKGLGHDCDEEAVRVISAMPNWTPGRQAGHPVNFKYNAVVPFGSN